MRVPSAKTLYRVNFNDIVGVKVPSTHYSLTFYAVVPALVWGHYIIMAKQNTMTVGQINKGWNAVVKETHTLNQVLKSFGGIMSKKLPELEGLTVSEFLTANGIEVVKGKVSVSSIRKAWNVGMLVDGKLAIFKNVPALWTPEEGSDLWEKNVRSFRVCSKVEAEKYIKTGEFTPFTMFKLVPVDDYRWDTAVIARAMKQGQKFDKNNDRAVESELAWEDMEEAYIVYDMEISKGHFERKMRRVAKADVKF